MSDCRYVLNGGRKGPISDAQLHLLLMNRSLTAGSLVWTAGMGGWQPVAQVSALSSLLASVPPEIRSVGRNPRPVGTWSRIRPHLGSSVALILGCLGLLA